MRDADALRKLSRRLFGDLAETDPAGPDQPMQCGSGDWLRDRLRPPPPDEPGGSPHAEDQAHV
jgi:hypothetical protein